MAPDPTLVALLLAGHCATNFATAQKRLRITNGCSSEEMWIAHMAAKGTGSDPQNLKLEPRQSYDFSTPDGLTGTRYWAKMRCDANGNNCGIGESGGPGETCDTATGCTPPVDTKFEASFGENGEDWVDISLVDGFTLPFQFRLTGECGDGFGEKSRYFSIDATWKDYCDSSGRRYYHNPSTGETTFSPPKIIDCSKLAFDQCPTEEDLGSSGKASLLLTHPQTRKSVGCFSPCSKLTLGQWSAPPLHAPPDKYAAPYCCPTPPESPESCRTGPIEGTKFVQAVHQMCPGVYGYSYDDGMGLLKCSSDTKYEVIFYCPADRTSPSPPLPRLNTTPCASTLAPTPAPVPSWGPAPTGTPVPTWTTVPTWAPVPVWTPAPPRPFFLITVIRRIFHSIGLSESGHNTGQNQNFRSWTVDGVALKAITIFTIAVAFVAMIFRKVRHRGINRYSQISTPRTLEEMM